MKPKILTIHNIGKLQNRWITKEHYIKDIQILPHRYYIKIHNRNGAFTLIEIGRLLIDAGKFTLHTDNCRIELNRKYLKGPKEFGDLLADIITQ